MRAINHALTGAVVGLSISEPFVAIPLAFVSHFALDAVPHYNPKGSVLEIIRDNKFVPVLVIDALLCMALVVILVIVNPQAWLMPAICAFVATSPDFLSIGYFIEAKKRNRIPEYKNKFMIFLGTIQWFQRPIGAFVEVAWFFTMVFIVKFLLQS